MRKEKRKAETKADAKSKFSISGDNGERDPPVPIPNTEVKPLSADGTWLATARESRTPPDSNKGVSRKTDAFSFLQSTPESVDSSARNVISCIQ